MSENKNPVTISTDADAFKLIATANRDIGSMTKHVQRNTGAIALNKKSISELRRDIGTVAAVTTAFGRNLNTVTIFGGIGLIVVGISLMCQAKRIKRLERENEEIKEKIDAAKEVK